MTNGSGAVLYGFSYDGTGNFTSNGLLGTVNSVNEYSTLTYNARHDLTNDGTDAYGYDALDQLISVTPDHPSTGSSEAEYGYDGQGRMAWEDVYTWAGSWTLSTTYHFVWSGSELIEKLDGNNNVLRQYTWGPGENGTDQVLLLTNYTGSTGTSYTLTYDASGNVIMMENVLTGAVVANYAYTPYGALVYSTGPEAGINLRGGKGYWTDAVAPGLAWAGPATGYATTRVENLTAGVWQQPDPSGIRGGDNVTEYLSNDPINNTDPSGLQAEEGPGEEDPEGEGGYGPRPPGALERVEPAEPAPEPGRGSGFEAAPPRRFGSDAELMTKYRDRSQSLTEDEIERLHEIFQAEVEAFHTQGGGTEAARPGAAGAAEGDLKRTEELLKQYQRAKADVTSGRGIYLVGMVGGAREDLAELDEVHDGTIYEDKDSTGFNDPLSDYGGDIFKWSKKNIYDAGLRKIDAIKNAIDTRPGSAKAGPVPAIQNLQSIRTLVFRIQDSGNQDLKTEIGITAKSIEVARPGWTVRVIYDK